MLPARIRLMISSASVTSDMRGKCVRQKSTNVIQVMKNTETGNILIMNCPDPCINRGECLDLVGDYNCTCQAGYEGRNCEININEERKEPKFDISPELSCSLNEILFSSKLWAPGCPSVRARPVWERRDLCGQGGRLCLCLLARLHRERLRGGDQWMPAQPLHQRGSLYWPQQWLWLPVYSR